jgi:integrase/recombinase XerD
MTFMGSNVPAGANRGRQWTAEWYEPPVVEAVLGQCSTSAATGVRDLAILAVTWRGALRADCEALSLTPADISGSKIAVRHGKGGKARTVTVSSGCTAIIDRWLHVRGGLGLGLGKDDPLFVTLQGRRVSYQATDAMFKRRAGRAWPDSAERWHLHALRHSRAIELERAGTPISIISAFLGHANISVTSIYLNGLHRSVEMEAAGNDDWVL